MLAPLAQKAILRPSPVILLQRRVLVGKRDDARNQILTIAGFEDGYSVGAPCIEVRAFVCRVNGSPFTKW